MANSEPPPMQRAYHTYEEISAKLEALRNASLEYLNFVDHSAHMFQNQQTALAKWVEAIERAK